MKTKLAFSLALVFFMSGFGPGDVRTSGSKEDDLLLNQLEASHFASLALKCISKEYPSKPEHVLNEGRDVKSPKTLHPAFYGCYDWHSSVHGHWMLVRLLKLFPTLPEAQQIRSALATNLRVENILAEAAYVKQPNRQSFECRPTPDGIAPAT